MQRAAFFWAKTKPFFELTLIDNLIDNNCLLIFIPRFLIIFIGIKDAVFLLYKKRRLHAFNSRL